MRRDDFVTTLAQLTARELDLFCEKRGLAHANEHHLAKACKNATAKLVLTSQARPTLGPFGFGDRLGWIGLGLVDVVLHWSDSAPTFVELKFGTDLSACVWDAVKLAAGVLNGNAESGYLLAGAPTFAWSKPAAGAEFFADAGWRTTGSRIRDAYRKQWWSWQEEVVKGHPNRHLPGRVPETFETVALGSFPFEIGGTAWELRLARVEPRGSTWTVWKCVSP